MTNFVRRLVGSAARESDPVRLGQGAVALEASGIVLARGGRQVLTDFNLKLHGGELVSIIGPNGVGKSTALSVLAGDVPADSGTVSVLGSDPQSLAPVELARRRAVMTQHHRFPFDFTVTEVVEMGRWAAPSSVGGQGDDTELADALTSADLDDLAERPVTELSGGERARVAFARMMLQGSPVVLADEPTASLDLRHQHLLMRRLRDRARAGAAVAAVLHDLALAAEYSDRVVLLAPGGATTGAEPVADVLVPERLEDAYGCRIVIGTHPGTVDQGRRLRTMLTAYGHAGGRNAALRCHRMRARRKHLGDAHGFEARLCRTQRGAGRVDLAQGCVSLLDGQLRAAIGADVQRGHVGAGCGRGRVGRHKTHLGTGGARQRDGRWWVSGRGRTARASRARPR